MTVPRATEPLEGFRGQRQLRLGFVDPAPPPQPFGVVKPELRAFEWPFFAGWSESAAAK
jgi:hypothetical protein